jgi:hypothetical protein
VIKAAGGSVRRLMAKFVKAPQALVVGARFPHWMSQCPEWASASLAVASGLARRDSGISQGNATGWWIVGLVFFAVLAILIAAARSGERLRAQNLVMRVERDLNEDRQNLLGNQLTCLIQLVAEAVAEGDKTLRLQRTNAARAALIAATANLVGRRTAAGTVRANLFELSEDRQSMVLAPGGFAGRGIRSVRKFVAGDPTFEATMVEQSRFVRSVKDELVGSEQNLPYETFLTFPVSIGRSRIHGVLTADSTKTGDLDSAEDVPMMGILTALLTITYECQKYPNPRNSSAR